MAITRPNFDPAAGDDTSAALRKLDNNDVGLDARVTAAQAAADAAQGTANAASGTANAAMPKTGGGFSGPITVTNAGTNLLELIGTGQYTGQFYTNGVVKWLQGAANFNSPPTGVPAGAWFVYEWPNSVRRISVAPNGGAIALTGNVNVSATLTAVAVTQTSSFEVKENIHAFDGALDVIDRISVVTFTYDPVFIEEDGKTRLGVLAENVEVALPSAYTPSATALMEDGEEEVTPASVDYAQFGPLALRAIQELRAELSAMKLRVETLEANG
jgi:hypothetical protein